MKLLLDQNLSQRLLPVLKNCFPGSKHVKDFGLTGDDDENIWQFAKNSGFVLVSKDADFYYRSLLRGAPPKFIYIQTGNCSTKQIAEILLSRVDLITDFISDPAETILLLK